ncbi:hypothetical protein MBLNU13_g08249t1 [Cladosporium sp. NU13]
MDPATTIGVAAAIVQFVEVGLKTLALCKQIRDSDTDTTLLHAELQQSTKQVETVQRGVTLTSFPRDTSRSIKQCSQDCSSTAKELQDLLSEIRAIAQKKRFGAARAAFRALKDQKKIEKIQNKLEKCQARFQTAVSVDTREKVLSLLQAQGNMSQTLEDVVYPELKRMHESTQDQISDAQKSSAAAHEITHKALTNLNNTSRASKRAILDVGAQVQGRIDHLQITHTQRAFLQSLEHPDMFSRHRQIHAPATGTFEWLFMEGSSRNDQSPRSIELQGRFSKWLRSSQPVFWINGKAGSGKSSLMAFIESHERTHDLLKIWAGGRRLHVLSFFFWRAGSEIQKSIPGVLQSLLYQLVRAKPEIISSLNSNEITSPGRTWTHARLHRAIETALPHFREERIFVLIDGLDEFEGSYTALTTLILGLQNGSHSKFCLSSRPETALTRQLGSFPSLRLQDLNYDDIERFVNGQLKSYENVYGDPHQFHEMTYDVSNRAEGIFLWAALVCKSLVSGFESMDDADMLRERLDTIPSGLEALFALMFSNIDREHREYLSKCFFLLKWSRENDPRAVSEISIPVITAFLSASPHKSLSDFVQDFRVVGNRVIAQARGLLETRQPEMSMFHPGPNLQEVEVDTPSDMPSVSPETSLTETNRTTCIGWVHRSAYDYILGDHSEHFSSWQNSVNEERLLGRLLEAQSWLAHHLPGQHVDYICAPAMRIVDVFEGHKGDIKTAGFQALDKLYDTIQASYDRGRCNDLDQSPVFGSKLHRIHEEEAEPLRLFWMSLAKRLQNDYIVTRFDKIKSSAHADLLCSGLIQHYWFWDKHKSSQCMISATTLIFDHLLSQGPMGDLVIAAGLDDVSFEWVATSCLLWRGRGGSKERRMVSDVVAALKELTDQRHRSSFDTGKGSTDYIPDAPEILGHKLMELADLWQIYCGPLIDSSGVAASTTLQLYVSARVYELRFFGQANSSGTISSDRALPEWRLVCFGRSERRNVHLWMSGEHVPVVACFDVKAPGTKQLMDRFGHVQCDRSESLITLQGTSEDEALCLETILEEMWKDANGQFDDGWQQLYMLACLKKHFGDLWNLPKVSSDSTFVSGSDHKDES